MIRQINTSDILECVRVIRESFSTVADDLGFSAAEAPRFTAFATTEDRLRYHFIEEQRPMYAFYENDTIVGYYSLLALGNSNCELNNLCVLPSHRHKGIGKALLKSAFDNARKLGCTKISIGIIEENIVLKKWYELFGFVHIGTKKFDFFPFTCGYMEKIL